MAVAVIIFLIVALWTAFFAISRDNPFDRVLFRKEYYLTGFDLEKSIFFTKHATQRSVRKAIFHIMYTYPDTKSLVFDNLPKYDFPQDSFWPFEFSRLDFSKCDCIENRYTCLMTISCALPCSILVLPRNISVFHFHTRCDFLHCLIIPGSDLIHAYLEPELGRRHPATIHVSAGFKIKVPSSLVSDYQSDPAWSSLKFEDENGNVFPPMFSALSK